MNYNNTIKNIDNDLKLINKSIKELSLVHTDTGADYNSIQHAIKNMKKIKSDLQELRANLAWEQPATYINKMIAQSTQINADYAKQDEPGITCVTADINDAPTHNSNCLDTDIELNK